jgi:transposase-like protein
MLLKPRPPCPSCDKTDDVKTVRGGTKGYYLYTCTQCGEEWQAVPPYRSGIVKERARRKMRPYKCSICLQLKRGHTCTGFPMPDPS